MTDKQTFDNLKKQAREHRTKKKMVQILRANVNAKLSFEVHSEEEKLELLKQLRAIEVNDVRLRRNKYSSKFYNFEPVDRNNFGFKSLK